MSHPIAEGQPTYADGYKQGREDEALDNQNHPIAEGQPTEGTHDHCNCYRLHGRKCCICDSEPESWEIQCDAQDPDGWCCGLSTGHAGDHDFHASTWDVFRKSPVAVTKDDPYTECAKAMCEMCDGQAGSKFSSAVVELDGIYWHQVLPPDGLCHIGCKASPIWEKVKK